MAISVCLCVLYLDHSTPYFPVLYLCMAISSVWLFFVVFLVFFGKEGSQEIKSKEIQISGNECKMSIHCVIFDNEEE